MMRPLESGAKNDTTRLDEGRDRPLNVDHEGRIERFEQSLFDRARPDLHDLDPQREVLQRQSSHLGLRVFGHLALGKGGSQRRYHCVNDATR